MKKIFIIPGFKQKTTDKQFVWLKKFLITKGFSVSMVPITWDRRTMTDYALEFENFYERHKAKDNYVLGFSYGAVIAFITANKLKPKKIKLSFQARTKFWLAKRQQEYEESGNLTSIKEKA